MSELNKIDPIQFQRENEMVTQQIADFNANKPAIDFNREDVQLLANQLGHGAGHVLRQADDAETREGRGRRENGRHDYHASYQHGESPSGGDVGRECSVGAKRMLPRRARRTRG